MVYWSVAASGSGNDQDWAAKGTILLGVKDVQATTFERIHRTNLIGMSVLPLQFADGQSAEELGLTGEETFSITGLQGSEEIPEEVTVLVDSDQGTRELTVRVRIETRADATYYRRGGIMPYGLRQMRYGDAQE